MSSGVAGVTVAVTFVESMIASVAPVAVRSTSERVIGVIGSIAVGGVVSSAPNVVVQTSEAPSGNVGAVVEQRGSAAPLGAKAVVVRDAEDLPALAADVDRARSERGRGVQVVPIGVDEQERPAELPVGIEHVELPVAARRSRCSRRHRPRGTSGSARGCRTATSRRRSRDRGRRPSRRRRRR